MTAATADYAISVLIPAYNTEAYVAEALESVLAQTRPPAEVIVVDDGSTDGTYARLQSFESRIRLLGPERRGFGAARNFLLTQARHPWIAYHDADDIWMPDKLEKQVAWLAANPGHDGCIALSEQFIEPGCAPPQTFRKDLLREPSAQLYVPNLLAPRHIFEHVGPFETTDALGTDSEWFVRARDAGIRFGVVPEMLYRRRLHDTNYCYEMEFGNRMLAILRRSVERKRRTHPAKLDGGSVEGQSGA